MLRFLFLVPIAAALAGCVTTGAGTETVSEPNASTVLLHTSFNDFSCSGVGLGLAQRNAEGRWVFHKSVQLKSMFEETQTPSQFKLAPGEYGIAGLSCTGRKRSFHTNIAQRPNVWTGAPVIYEGVFATFTVLPNEVVDIGSFRHSTGTIFGGPRVMEMGVAPIPEEALRALAEKDPELYRRRVARPMISKVRGS